MCMVVVLGRSIAPQSEKQFSVSETQGNLKERRKYRLRLIKMGQVVYNHSLCPENLLSGTMLGAIDTRASKSKHRCFLLP